MATVILPASVVCPASDPAASGKKMVEKPISAQNTERRRLSPGLARDRSAPAGGKRTALERARAGNEFLNIAYI